MRNSTIRTIYLLAYMLLIFQCANRGIASGGDKDDKAPVVIKEGPVIFSSNFSGNDL